MNTLKVSLILIFASLSGCAPEPSPPQPYPQGITLSTQPGAKPVPLHAVVAEYEAVALCVAQYVPTPRIKLTFMASQPSPQLNGMATYRPDTGNVDIEVYSTDALSTGIIRYTLQHEFVHAALFYYGVTDQNTHRDHLSIKFDECVGLQ